MSLSPERIIYARRGICPSRVDPGRDAREGQTSSARTSGATLRAATSPTARPTRTAGLPGATGAARPLTHGTIGSGTAPWAATHVGLPPVGAGAVHVPATRARTAPEPGATPARAPSPAEAPTEGAPEEPDHTYDENDAYHYEKQHDTHLLSLVVYPSEVVGGACDGRSPYLEEA